MRTLALASAAVALCVALPGGASGHAAKIRSGLYGHATKGPLTPVCSTATPCYGPAKRAKITFMRRGHVVARTWTDANADYRIALRPGRYVLRSRIGFGAVDPRVVRVERGRFLRADLSLDTGIR